MNSFKRNVCGGVSGMFCLGIVAVLNGCGGGGSSGSLNLNRQASNFSGKVEVPAVVDAPVSVCSNASRENLELSSVIITVNPNQSAGTDNLTGQITAVGLGEFLVRGSYIASSQNVSFTGRIRTYDVSFNGVIKEVDGTQRLEGVLDLKCWKTEISLIARKNSTPPLPVARDYYDGTYEAQEGNLEKGTVTISDFGSRASAFVFLKNPQNPARPIRFPPTRGAVAAKEVILRADNTLLMRFDISGDSPGFGRVTFKYSVILKPETPVDESGKYTLKSSARNITLEGNINLKRISSP
jgi:hypothetical protein